MIEHRKLCAALLLIVIFLYGVQNAAARRQVFQASQIFTGAKFYRSELYFGMNKGDDSVVSEEDWKNFLAAEVTTRFPNGFTVLESYGQYKTSAGKIVHEQSRLLVLFYPKNERRAVDLKIEELRAIYKKQFDQETVLRLDFRQPIAVSY